MAPSRAVANIRVRNICGCLPVRGEYRRSHSFARVNRVTDGGNATCITIPGSRDDPGRLPVKEKGGRCRPPRFRPLQRESGRIRTLAMGADVETFAFFFFRYAQTERELHDEGGSA